MDDDNAFKITLEAGQYAVVPDMPVCGYTVTESADSQHYNMRYQVYQTETGDTVSTVVDTSGEVIASGNTGSMERTFAAGKTDTGSETATSKSSITVENTGNIPAYIRVRFVSYWVDTEGHAVGKASKMPNIPYDANAWFEQNGIYYCKTPVAVGALTPELLQSGKTIVLRADMENGYRQVLEVFADAIQSEPNKAVTQSWNVEISDGNIAPKT